MDIFGWNIILWIAIGLIAGWLAGLITRERHNLAGDLVLGLIGALVAGFVVEGAVGAQAGFVGSIIAAVIAAVVLVLLKNLFTRGSHRHAM